MPPPIAAAPEPELRWFFDVVSPFSYLQFARLEPLRQNCRIEYLPILFAGLLKHWQQKGPAEIDGKRLFTYRHCTWLAQRRGLAFRFPPRHPFNPLPALRLILALDAREDVVRQVFEFIWAEGRDLGAAGEFAALAQRLGVSNVEGLIETSGAKRRLQENTDAAIAAGVFGVPTFLCRGELFWGDDATEMVADFIADPQMLERPEMRRLRSLDVGAARRT